MSNYSKNRLSVTAEHPSTPAHSPRENHLLASLPTSDLAKLERHLSYVAMPLGHMLYEPGARLTHAYFPTTSIVSLHYVTESGASAETAGVGNEGVVGVFLFMGGGTTPSSAVVQTAGHGYRIESRALNDAFDSTRAVQSLLLRYTQALITQMTQTAACYRHHSVEQQSCRWLLLTIDRMQSSELTITQELVANMLGVRRESVTEAVGTLQRAGCIRRRRGHISIVDRGGLELRCCECYAAVKTELARLLTDVKLQAESMETSA